MNSSLILQNKVVLVTGASSGIGRQIAIEASAHGAKLIITGRNKQNLEETKSLLTGEVTSIAADLSNENGVRELVNTLPQLHGVVFCAGIIEYCPIKFINEEKIDNIFSINFKSPVLMTQQLLKAKKIEKGGSLVYISSISSKLGVASTGLYAASKAALSAFARVTASECASQQIRSNSISPGIVITPMTNKAVEASSQEDIKKTELDYPLGFGIPKDIAGMAMFLLNDSNRWITGSDIVMDGGLTLK